MTHLQQLKEILDGQAERAIKDGWEDCSKYEQYSSEICNTCLELKEVKLTFVFSNEGRFLGICNWKD